MRTRPPLTQGRADGESAVKFLRKNILFHLLLISLFSQVRSFPNQFMPPPVKWLQQLELACRATEWLHFIFLPYTQSHVDTSTSAAVPTHLQSLLFDLCKKWSLTFKFGNVWRKTCDFSFPLWPLPALLDPVGTEDPVGAGGVPWPLVGWGQLPDPSLSWPGPFFWPWPWGFPRTHSGMCTEPVTSLLTPVPKPVFAISFPMPALQDSTVNLWRFSPLIDDPWFSWKLLHLGMKIMGSGTGILNPSLCGLGPFHSM